MNNPFSIHAPPDIKVTAFIIALTVFVSALVTLYVLFMETMLVVTLIVLLVVFLLLTVPPIIKQIYDLFKYIFLTKED